MERNIVAGDELFFRQRFLESQQVARRPLRVREDRMRYLLLLVWLTVLLVSLWLWRNRPLDVTQYPVKPPSKDEVPIEQFQRQSARDLPGLRRI